jgi:hypothetical protein
MKLHRLLGLIDNGKISKYYLRAHAEGSIYGMRTAQVRELSVNPIKMELTLFTKKKKVEGFVEPTLLNSTAYYWVGEVSRAYPGATVYLCVLYDSHNKQ